MKSKYILIACLVAFVCIGVFGIAIYISQREDTSRDAEAQSPPITEQETTRNQEKEQGKRPHTEEDKKARANEEFRKAMQEMIKRKPTTKTFKAGFDK